LVHRTTFSRKILQMIRPNPISQRFLEPLSAESRARVSDFHSDDPRSKADVTSVPKTDLKLWSAAYSPELPRAVKRRIGAIQPKPMSTIITVLGSIKILIGCPNYLQCVLRH
jgi:hypothetical protein